MAPWHLPTSRNVLRTPLHFTSTSYSHLLLAAVDPTGFQVSSFPSPAWRSLGFPGGLPHVFLRTDSAQLLKSDNLVCSGAYGSLLKFL